MLITYRGGLVLDVFIFTCKVVYRFPGPSESSEDVFNEIVDEIMKGDFG